MILGRRPAVIVAALLFGLLAACGDPAVPAGTSGKQIKDIDPAVVPTSILDLVVTSEDIRSTLARVERSYIEEAGLFSMRREDEVQATLQIIKFNATADLDDADFRRGLVGQVGGATPQTGKLGESEVYFVRGVQQNLSVFFEGSHLFVLSVRDEYEQPRNLLRAVLELDL